MYIVFTAAAAAAVVAYYYYFFSVSGDSVYLSVLAKNIGITHEGEHVEHRRFHIILSN